MANRLISEESAYLLQHANNPVDWYAWGDEALNRAKSEKRAIFISIGYSSCHWCHVMEREVFENESAAKILNKHFICIKVDKEERPDIDKYYQDVYMLLNRKAGGWPTSIFSTYDNKPIFAATFIPLNSKNRQMGFMELIDIIAEKVTDDDPELFKNANEIEQFINRANSPKKPLEINSQLSSKLLDLLTLSFDKANGGFSDAPKFPQASTLLALLELYGLKKERETLNMVTYTLDSMVKGGFYDLVDGGFCRYSTDDMWSTPHFEKMTYDNALLVEVYLRAYEITKSKKYLKVANETIEFMNSFMMEDNLYYSASDADTNGTEGEYFVYTKEEVRRALMENGFSADETTSISEAMSISEEGNFEGKNIIRLENETPNKFEKVKLILQKIREGRSYPSIDKKIILSWNAMMAKSLFIASSYEKSYLSQAISTIDELLKMLSVNGNLMHSGIVGKEPKVEAFLEDYAYLSDALLSAYEATLSSDYLMMAQQYTDLALGKFYEHGRWYFSRGSFETQADINDSSYPSPVSVIASVLLKLGALREEKYALFAFKTLEFYSAIGVKNPDYHTSFTRATMQYMNETILIKGTKETLWECLQKEKIEYPYALFILSSEPNIQLCTQHSCFTLVKSCGDVNNKINSYLVIGS